MSPHCQVHVTNHRLHVIMTALSCGLHECVFDVAKIFFNLQAAQCLKLYSFTARTSIGISKHCPKREQDCPQLIFFTHSLIQKKAQHQFFAQKTSIALLSLRGDLSSSPLKFFLCVQYLTNGVRFRPIQWIKAQGWIIIHLQPPNRGWMKLINKVIFYG